MNWAKLESWVMVALDSIQDPILLALILALTTLLLEDLAIAAGLALAQQGTLSWELSLSAVALGIAFGDLALYGMGLWSRRATWLRQRLLDGRFDQARNLLDQRLIEAVFLARIIPGLRLVTYTAAGFLRLSFTAFTLYVCVAVLLWTGGMYLLGATLGQVIATHYDIPLAIAVALPILFLAALLPLLRKLVTSIARRVP